MEDNVKAGPDSILENVYVDKVGVIRLDDHVDTPVWRRARELLPGSKSVIVLALEVFSEVVKYLSSKRQIGEMSLRDLFIRNLEVVDGQLDWEAYRIVKKLHGMGFSGLSLTAGGAPYDSRFLGGSLSYVPVAQLAGLGVVGWHSMLITPEYGARVRLALVLTDAPLEPRTLEAGDIPCIECGGACIRVCPVKAIGKPQKGEQYRIDKYACSTYLEATASCSECLKVCPAGRVP